MPDRLRRAVPALVALALFLAALEVLRTELRTVSWHGLTTDVLNTPPWRLTVAVFLTALNYAVMAKPNIKNWADMKGKTIIVGGPKDNTVYYTRVMNGDSVVYQAVAPPAGAIITTLPAGCTTANVGGVAYTQCGPTYYTRVSNGYQVVVLK